MRRFDHRHPAPSILTAALVALVTLAKPGWAADSSWQLVKSESGIQVYHRDVAGSDFVQFKGDTIVDAPISSLVAVLKDVAACDSWQHKCGRIIVLSPEYACQITDVPWPLSDRYAVLHFRFVTSAEEHIVTMHVRNILPSDLPAKLRAKVPPLEGLMRMQRHDGFWKLTKQGAASTKVIYQMHLDPGGNIPSSISNAGSVDKPFVSLSGMKRIVRQSKYKHAPPLF